MLLQWPYLNSVTITPAMLVLVSRLTRHRQPGSKQMGPEGPRPQFSEKPAGEPCHSDINIEVRRGAMRGEIPTLNMYFRSRERLYSLLSQ